MSPSRYPSARSGLKPHSGGEPKCEGGRGATNKINVGYRRLSSDSNSNLNSKLENKNSHNTKNTTFAGNVGLVEKVNTPVKRKLLEHRPVHNLVLKFESSDELPGLISTVGCSESPAKRRKIRPGVSQPN